MTWTVAQPSRRSRSPSTGPTTSSISARRTPARSARPSTATSKPPVATRPRHDLPGPCPQGGVKRRRQRTARSGALTSCSCVNGLVPTRWPCRLVVASRKPSSTNTRRRADADTRWRPADHPHLAATSSNRRRPTAGGCGHRCLRGGGQGSRTVIGSLPTRRHEPGAWSAITASCAPRAGPADRPSGDV